MLVLDRLEKNSIEIGSDTAIHSTKGSISYGDLFENSGKLALWLDLQLGDNKKPIVVYGHKDPFMVLCFLACVKSGRAYCPVDASMPMDRIKDIISTVESPIVLATEELCLGGSEFDRYRIIDSKQINGIINSSDKEISKDKWVKDNEVFYIIFTSGSTGKPKGVQITYNNLNNFVNWFSDVATTREEKKGKVFLNQAPFSFDLSVMDLYTCLSNGGTLWATDKELQWDMTNLMSYIALGNLNYWVSTPSFADMCLADKGFNGENFPDMKAFFFCGETLTCETAKKLLEAFPKAKVINTYGPTESTVAVTSIEITLDLTTTGKPLPVGKPKQGTIIEIVKPDGSLAEEKESGEIVIIGDTVSAGYFAEPDKTSKVFSYEDETKYRTGDEGYMEDGILHFCGRMDSQIKFHGYRIELGDIEANLMELPSVQGAVVVTRKSGEKIRNLVGFVICDKLSDMTDFKRGQEIREQLKVKLPEYMVPKKIVFVDKFPMTTNGKVDRRKMEESV
ncbi:MAG: D-alanine--poly(phosphoribitol) ligase subunit DltA [Anaerovoracaceae bacterium]